MIKKINLISLIFVVAIFAESKPFKGFSVFLIGEPHQDSVFMNTVPAGEGAIFSLAETPDGGVLGATRILRGKTPWLFYFDPLKKKIEQKNTWQLTKFFSGESCVTALVAASNGKIYGSTSNLVNIAYNFKKDIEALNYKGGHVFTVECSASKFELKDLGIPFPGEGIVTLTADYSGSNIYGVTVPSQIFFRINTTTGKIEKVGSLDTLEMDQRRYMGKSSMALVSDTVGNIYGSRFGGRLFKFDAKSGLVDTINVPLPTVDGQSYDCVSAFIRTKSGRIFGGTFLDGKLFEFIPSSKRIVDLGITSRTGNVCGLVEKDNILYGLSGGKDSPKKLFAYNISTGEYYQYPSNLRVFFDGKPDHRWRPYFLKNLLLLKNGQIATAEDDSQGHFYLWEPVKVDFVR
ncbi:MAG: hypothetical protein JNL74_07625 [Fibrobacteres bacterium]|nr:hypothetical protein [Fibrobacterota bacterium]